MMTSIFPIAYGFSKFVSGVLGSRTSATMLLAGGLMATAVLNIAFGFSTSLIWFCSLWAMNGMLQGVGAPCCARILTAWFAAKERGTYWGMWNIAHNMGGFLAPVLAGTAAKLYGWKWGMFAPGIVGLVMGAFILLGVRDTPEAAGFPPVEPIKVEKVGGAGRGGTWESAAAAAASSCLSLLAAALSNTSAGTPASHAGQGRERQAQGVAAQPAGHRRPQVRPRGPARVLPLPGSSLCHAHRRPCWAAAPLTLTPSPLDRLISMSLSLPASRLPNRPPSSRPETRRDAAPASATPLTWSR